MAKSKRKVIVEIGKLEREIDSCRVSLNRIQRKIAKRKILIENKRLAEQKIENIEKKFRQESISHLLGNNTEYIRQKRLLNNLNNEIAEIDINSLNFQLEVLNASHKRKLITLKILKQGLRDLRKVKERKTGVKANQKIEKVEKAAQVHKKYSIPQHFVQAKAINCEVDWNDVFFEDGSIKVQFQKQFYIKSIKESKAYLNKIKHYYNFHNVPRLQVVLRDSAIIEIKNQAVLFYHIFFFSSIAPTLKIGNTHKFDLKNWEKYTSSYFKSSLTFLLHTDTLMRLCEYCDPNLPIIPVGEVVKNRNGTVVIHSSFLFPLANKQQVSVVWESTEEKKASYVFSVQGYTSNCIMNLFSYITGDTQNKRETLIRSTDLQRNLRMKKRLLHNDMNAWNEGIREYCL